MIHHLVLCKLRPDAKPQALEELMRQARMSLLRIDEVRSMKCGKRTSADNGWAFFYSIDTVSLDRLAAVHRHPIYLRFIDTVITPHVAEQLAVSYEMDPGKDVRYS